MPTPDAATAKKAATTKKAAAPPPEPPPDDDGQADVDEAQPDDDTPEYADPEEGDVGVGNLVEWTHFDPFRPGGAGDTTDLGVVVAVEETGARVAWFRDISDPLPLEDLAKPGG